MPKSTLTQKDLIINGKFPVINSGRTFYGRYDKFNNKGNAITLASRGEYAGFINYIECDFWAGGLCYPYRSKNESVILTKFIYYLLKTKEKYIMEILVDRGSIPALNKSTLENIELIIPPLEVQEEIVNILDKFEEYVNSVESGLKGEIELRHQQYEYYRDKLLTFDRKEYN